MKFIIPILIFIQGFIIIALFINLNDSERREEIWKQEAIKLLDHVKQSGDSHNK